MHFLNILLKKVIIFIEYCLENFKTYWIQDFRHIQNLLAFLGRQVQNSSFKINSKKDSEFKKKVGHHSF